MNEIDEQKYTVMIGQIKHVLNLPQTTTNDVMKLCSRLVADYCETGEKVDYQQAFKKQFDAFFTVVLVSRAREGKNDD